MTIYCNFWFTHIFILIIIEVVPAGFDAESQDDKNDGKSSSKATTFRAQLVEEELKAADLWAQPTMKQPILACVELLLVEKTTTRLATELLTHFN